MQGSRHSRCTRGPRALAKPSPDLYSKMASLACQAAAGTGPTRGSNVARRPCSSGSNSLRPAIAVQRQQRWRARSTEHTPEVLKTGDEGAPAGCLGLGRAARMQGWVPTRKHQLDRGCRRCYCTHRRRLLARCRSSANRCSSTNAGRILLLPHDCCYLMQHAGCTADLDELRITERPARPLLLPPCTLPPAHPAAALLTNSPLLPAALPGWYCRPGGAE